ncbi:MAG: 50S ribosomal protein L6 [Saccharolobus sp.]|jgi:large subunit ribosomal protein L6|uniref:50S ribosomal protein L6 n=1 Tax=Saccharolobus sp. TaxID=2100761 RepID=UPI0028CF8788|nr:50S ribosomal protein L6 [Saccharolobus sp.]MDT7860816.1 50S ribosomal protein L6 [Saccharolobus sp.]
MRAVILKEEIQIPDTVTVRINNLEVAVKGPKGEIIKNFNFAKGIIITLSEDRKKILLETNFADRRKKALFYSIISHIENMIVGVTKGYRYYLKIIYTHFPISVKVVGNEVQITNLIGEKNVRRAKILPGVKVTVKGDDIVVDGINLEAVAQTAANIEAASKISGFDRRVFSDGIYIYKKEVIE